MEQQQQGPSTSHVTPTGHVTPLSHVTNEKELADHVTAQIVGVECRTVLDLYRCLVSGCLELHFSVVYLRTAGYSDTGENVVCLEVQDRLTATSLASLKLFIIGARIVGHLRMDDGLLITWTRDLAQSIRFDVPIGPRSFRDLLSEIRHVQAELVSKTVLHMKSQGGIINLPMLSRMPDNVIDKIFSFLSGSDLREMSFVCRRFKNIAYSDDLWRSVCKKHSWFSRLQQKDRLNGAWRAYYRQYRKFRNRRHRLRRELLEAGARAPTQPIIMINRRRGRRRGEDPQQPIMVIDRRRHRRHGAVGVAPNIRLNRGLRRGAANPPPPPPPPAPPAPPGAGAGAAQDEQQRAGPVRRVFARINPNRRLQIAVRRQQGRAQQLVPNPQQPVPNPEQPVPNPEQPVPNPEQPVPNPQLPALNPEQPVVNPRTVGTPATAQRPVVAINNIGVLPARGEEAPRPGGRTGQRSLGEAIGRGRALLEQQRRMIAEDMVRRRGTGRQQNLLSVSRRFEQTLQSASNLFDLIESAPVAEANQIASDEGLVEQRLVELQRLSQQFHQQAQRPPEPALPQVPAPVITPPAPVSADIPEPGSAVKPGTAHNSQPQNTAPAVGDNQADPVVQVQPNPIREADPQPPAAAPTDQPAPQNNAPAEHLPEVGQPIPVLAPFPDPPNEEEPADVDDQMQFQVVPGQDEQHFRINLNAEQGNHLFAAVAANRADPANEVIPAMRMEDGNLHINAGGVNIAIELPFRGDRAEPPPRVGAQPQRERVRLRGRLSHRNEQSPFFQLDPRNIQIMRARIAIIGSEFVKRIKCNLSGEFPPNHNFLTLELVYISNMIAKNIRESLDMSTDDPVPPPAPPPLPEFYPYFDQEMPGQEVLEGRVNAIAEIFNETLRNSLRSDKIFVNRKVRNFQHNTRDNNVHPPSDNLSLASQYFHRKVRELVSGSRLQLENVVVSGGEQTSEHRLTHRVLSVALGRPYEEINRRVVGNVNTEQEQRRTASVNVTLGQNSAENSSNIDPAVNTSDINPTENISDMSPTEPGSDINPTEYILDVDCVQNGSDVKVTTVEKGSNTVPHDDGERPGPSREYAEEHVTPGVRDNHVIPVSSDSKRNHSSEADSRESKAAKLS